MAGTSGYQGGLIAFEGSQELISTQFRLLPSSPNILTLPEIDQFMKEDSHYSASNPESYILRIHEAYDARAERAHSFLKESAPNRRRLVFINGGTASARMKCIIAIGEHYCKGDIAEAEYLFNNLIRDGVEGLRQALQLTPESYPAPISNEPEALSQEDDKHDQNHDVLNNPVYEAMRAADALDRRTESLQSNTGLRLLIPILRRSRSLPIRRLCIIPDTPSSGFSRASDDAIDESYSSDCSDEVYASCEPPSYDSLTPRSISFESAPATPVIIGEACLIDVRPLNSRFSSRGIRSGDYIYASTILNQDISLCDIHRPGSSKLDADNQNVPNSQRKRTSRSRRLSKNPRTSLKLNKSTRRRGPPSPLILTRSNKRLSSYADQSTNVRNDYVHHATYTEKNYIDKGSNTDEAGTSPRFWDGCVDPGDTSFQEVLPMVEDMVIHLKDGKPDLLLERIIRDLKEPPPLCISTSSLIPETKNEIEPEITRSPTLQQPAPCRSTRQEPDIETARSKSLHQLYADDYDPFASHGDYLQSCTIPSPKQKVQAPTSRVQSSKPPTPAHTPPPQEVAPSPKRYFYELNIATCHTAIEIQDTLRSALCTYCPSRDTHCLQPELPSILEIGGDWQPVFGKRKSGESEEHKRKIDLILAIGAQDGVEKEFSAALRASLDKLGTKPKGITRSGRLDLRYLIVNAQRAVAAQPSPGQTSGELSADPQLLAILVIPFLETYMAVHSETGFLLLEYPPDHLATILALQELIGSDLLKVAGILDDQVDDPSPTTYGIKGPEMRGAGVHPLSAARRLNSFPRGPSFSKANFVLTSTATESEIATFIAAVWKILADRSSFYIPDGAPSRTLEITHDSEENSFYDVNDRPFAQSPLISSTFQYTPLDSAAVMMGFRGSAATATATATTACLSYGIDIEEREEKPEIPPRRSTLLSTPPSTEMRKTKSSTSINSSRTAKAIQNQKAKLRNLLGRELDADSTRSIRKSRPNTSASFFDVSDDDDDDDDGEEEEEEEDNCFAADERRYMPLFMKKKHEVRKDSNSRKALRFLGISTE